MSQSTGQSPTRTLNDAFQLARPLALKGKRREAVVLMSNLLWHVDAANGGFVGLSGEQLAEKFGGDKRVDLAIATAAMWAPMPWPTTEQVAA